MNMKRFRRDDSPGDGGKPSNMSPDRTKSDFYCNICDSHMNSIQMWESHIAGKRHIKNTKKEPGEPPSKVKTVKRTDVPAVLEQQLKDFQEPVVGLDYVGELIKSVPNMDPTYTCYLCHGTFTTSSIIGHLVTTKHRLNYLKEVDVRSYEMIENLKMNKSCLDTLALGKASEWEKKQGRGRVEVKVEKSKFSLMPPPKKRRDELERSQGYYVDLDAPSTSGYTPDMPFSAAPPPEPLVTYGPHPPVPQGIEDIDVFRDVKMLSTSMQLTLVEEMILQSPPPIETESDARAFIEIMMSLCKMTMQSKVRKLTTDMQRKLLLDVMHPDKNKTYAGRLGLENPE